MEHRTLGRTGVKVSPLCLGAMMFGAWGNPDHDESIAIIHAALDAGINFIDTADVYSAGESEEIVGKALARAGATTWCWPPRCTARWARTRTSGGNSRRWIIAGLRGQPAPPAAPTTSTSTRSTDPTPTCDIDETLGALTDLVHQGKVRYIGSSTFPASEIVEAQWVAERRSRGALRVRAAALLDARAGHRGRRAAHLPALRHGRDPVEPARPAGWLSGRWRLGRRAPHQPAGRAGCRARYDLSMPENQRKLEAADALGRLADEAGISLVHLAVAWVLRHPAVTSAIIGPRTMEQLESQLDAADVALDDRRARPDRRDRPAGHQLPLADAGYMPAAVADPSRRRR